MNSKTCNNYWHAIASIGSATYPHVWTQLSVSNANLGRRRKSTSSQTSWTTPLQSNHPTILHLDHLRRIFEPSTHIARKPTSSTQPSPSRCDKYTLMGVDGCTLVVNRCSMGIECELEEETQTQRGIEWSTHRKSAAEWGHTQSTEREESENRHENRSWGLEFRWSHHNDKYKWVWVQTVTSESDTRQILIREGRERRPLYLQYHGNQHKVIAECCVR